MRCVYEMQDGEIDEKRSKNTFEWKTVVEKEEEEEELLWAFQIHW